MWFDWTCASLSSQAYHYGTLPKQQRTKARPSVKNVAYQWIISSLHFSSPTLILLPRFRTAHKICVTPRRCETNCLINNAVYCVCYSSETKGCTNMHALTFSSACEYLFDCFWQCIIGLYYRGYVYVWKYCMEVIVSKGVECIVHLTLHSMGSVYLIVVIVVSFISIILPKYYSSHIVSRRSL